MMPRTKSRNSRLKANSSLQKTARKIHRMIQIAHLLRDNKRIRTLWKILARPILTTKPQMMLRVLFAPATSLAWKLIHKIGKKS